MQAIASKLKIVGKPKLLTYLLRPVLIGIGVFTLFMAVVTYVRQKRSVNMNSSNIIFQTDVILIPTSVAANSPIPASTKAPAADARKESSVNSKCEAPNVMKSRFELDNQNHESNEPQSKPYIFYKTRLPEKEITIYKVCLF
jgi:hypothetical protein